jgi:hypothetical protein
LIKLCSLIALALHSSAAKPFNIEGPFPLDQAASAEAVAALVLSCASITDA